MNVLKQNLNMQQIYCVFRDLKVLDNCKQLNLQNYYADLLQKLTQNIFEINSIFEFEQFIVYVYLIGMLIDEDLTYILKLATSHLSVIISKSMQSIKSIQELLQIIRTYKNIQESILYSESSNYYLCVRALDWIELDHYSRKKLEEYTEIIDYISKIKPNILQISKRIQLLSRRLKRKSIKKIL